MSPSPCIPDGSAKTFLSIKSRVHVSHLTVCSESDWINPTICVDHSPSHGSRRLEGSADPGRHRSRADFPASIHATQLALAIDPGPLVIALCLRDETDPGGLLGLARTAEWLARETNARVLVVVPDTQVASTELDSINFEAVGWSRRPDRG